MIKESMFFTEPTIKDYREMDVEKIIREHLLTKGTWSHPTLKDEKPKPINKRVTPKSLVSDGLYTYGLKANATNKRAIEYYCERWARIHQIFDDDCIKVPDALWNECDEYNRKMTERKEDRIMPILNIELSEYDALRDRVKQLESENKNLSEAIEERVEKGLLRVIKKTVTITRNPWKAINELALDSCTEKYEFLNFDDIEQEAKSQFYKDMANRIQSQEQQEIRELKEQLKRSQEYLDSSLGRIDRLMKRNWWDRLWNKGVE